MQRWVWLLCLVFLAPHAGLAADKKAQAKANASTPEALMKDAEDKEAAGDVDGAVEVLKKAGAAGSGEALLRLGRLHEKRYELDLAIDDYASAVEKLAGAQKGEALGRRAVLEDVRGMPGAVASAEAAVEADASGVWPTIALARARAEQGKGDEAVELAKKAAAANGGAPASAALGYAEEARGDLAAAETAYRASLAAQAGAVAPTLGLARVLRKTNRAAEAEPLLQNVISTAPGAVEAYKESARVKLALNRAAEALGDASTAVAMAENDKDAQKLLRRVKVAQALENIGLGQTDLAIQDLTAARDQDPASAEVRLGLGKAYIAKRQADLALPELQKAVELEPSDAEAQYQLGFVQHVLKGNALAAVAAYDKATALEPGNAVYRTSLGAALMGSGQTDRAVVELTKVVESPAYTRPEAWIYLGQAHVAAKRYKEAIAALEKAVAIAPQSPEAQAFLAWAYFGLKDAANFKKYGAQARTLGWKQPELLDRLKRIEAGEAIK